MDPQRSAARARQLFEVYTKDLTASDLQRLFTRDAREAYAFFSRGVDRTAIDRLPWYRRLGRPQALLSRLHDAPVAGAAGDLRGRVHRGR